MKYLVVLLALILSIPTSGEAQSSGQASSTAGVTSTLNSNTDARSYTDARTLIDQRGPGNTDSTVRTAPQVSAPSMSSGHPCAYTPASASLSIIGGGIGAGGQKIDDACMLGQLGERSASVSMIAARNPDACKALRSAGRISANSTCTTEETKAARRAAAQPAATSTRSATTKTVAYSKCERSARGIEVRVARGGTKERAVAECRASLGF